MYVPQGYLSPFGQGFRPEISSCKPSAATPEEVITPTALTLCGKPRALSLVGCGSKPSETLALSLRGSKYLIFEVFGSKTIHLMVFATRDLECWVLGPSDTVPKARSTFNGAGLSALCSFCGWYPCYGSLNLFFWPLATPLPQPH